MLYSISNQQTLYERDDCMSRLLYSKYPILNKLFWFFQHYFKDATLLFTGQLDLKKPMV